MSECEGADYGVRFLRLERSSTGSFMTIELVKILPFSVAAEAAEAAEAEFLGWEVVTGCLVDPDGSLS